MESDEDRLDADIATMFDELVETHVSPEGAVTQKRTLTDDPLNGEAMRLACEKLVAAHKKFERLDSDVRKYTVKEVNLSWWDALNRMSEIERRVWRLFRRGASDTEVERAIRRMAQRLFERRRHQGGRLVAVARSAEIEPDVVTATSLPFADERRKFRRSDNIS